jgi:hypothetical protein
MKMRVGLFLFFLGLLAATLCEAVASDRDTKRASISEEGSSPLSRARAFFQRKSDSVGEKPGTKKKKKTKKKTKKKKKKKLTVIIPFSRPRCAPRLRMCAM